MATTAENIGMLAPCALCLLERWPHRIVVVLSLAGLVLPTRFARVALFLVALTVVSGVAIAGLHVGVEAGWWESPLAECTAPHLVNGTIAERLASMPERPVKPCDEPSYLVPELSVSVADTNFLVQLVAFGGLITYLWRTKSSVPRKKVTG
jgi:disulfide bond formation protein DsbB